MAREVCFLIGRDGSLLWADASDDPLRLPDSRARWEAIWSRRDRLVEIAHSHPVGPLGFSWEDETTMDALERALGRPLRFSVVAPRGRVVRWRGVDVVNARGVAEPAWVPLLRSESGMEVTELWRS